MAHTHKCSAGSECVMVSTWAKESHARETEHKLQISLLRNSSTNVSLPAAHVDKIGRWNVWA